MTSSMPPTPPPVPGGSRATAPSARTSGRAAHARHKSRGLMFGPSVQSALEALWANRLRSLLTILGVIVGVAAVIAVVTLTQGTSALLNARVASLGTNTLTITPGSVTTGGAAAGAGTRQSLTQADGDALASLAHVTAVSPVLSTSTQVIAGSENWSTRVEGVYPSYQQIGNWQLAEGSWFTAADEASATPVAVLGQTVVQNLFTPTQTDALGQTILIAGQSYQVVGVLQAKGTSGFANQDDVVFVPFATAHVRLNNSQYVNSIVVQVDTADNVTAVQQAVTTLMETRHQIPGGRPRRLHRAQFDSGLADRAANGADAGDLADRRRGHFAAGGGDRHHEYHAGLGDRAHP